VDIVVTPAQVANLNVQQQGAPQPPPLGLTAGQTVEALVLQTLADGRARIAVAHTVLDVETTVPLTPGDKVQLAVSDTPDGIKLTIVPAGSGGTPAPAKSSAASPSAGAVADLAKSFTTPNATAPATPVTPSAPAPAVALAEAVETAATRQGSLAPLMADVASLVDNLTLPPQVRDAAVQLLALRLSGGGDITAEDVQRAFTRSGTLMEARLGAAASGQLPVADPAKMMTFDNISDSPPDLKLALVVLRQVLKSWMDGSLTGGLDAPEHNTGSLPPTGTPGTTMPHTNANAPVPPPYRGGPTMGQPPVGPSIGPSASPEAIGAHLLAETDAAIARQTLMQAASLPDGHDQGLPRTQHADVRWNFEIPIMMPQGTTIAQFEIERDGQGRAPDDPQRVWRVRFALDVEPMGPVHGQISFNPSADGPRTSVMLWADREESATRLRANTQQLTEALRTAELAPGDVSVRAGNPPQVAVAPPAGHFLDRAS
jgi:hypothetical protein